MTKKPEFRQKSSSAVDKWMNTHRMECAEDQRSRFADFLSNFRASQIQALSSEKKVA
jgi:hypothetical protein